MLKTTVLLSLLVGAFAQDSSAGQTTSPAPTQATESVTQAIPASSGVNPGSIDPDLPQTPLATVSGFTIA